MEFNNLISEIKQIYQDVAELFTTDFLTVLDTKLSLWSIIVVLVVSVLILVYVSRKISKLVSERFLIRYDIKEDTRKMVGTIAGVSVFILGLFIAVRSVDPGFSIFEFFTNEFTLFKKPFSLWTLFLYISSIILLVYLSGRTEYLLSNKVLTRYRLDIGVRQSISTIIRYLILIIGLYIIISSTGIDLSALSILAGALGVGIGFGLAKCHQQFHFRAHHPF